jgi:hypothetical protein
VRSNTFRSSGDGSLTRNGTPAETAAPAGDRRRSRVEPESGRPNVAVGVDDQVDPDPDRRAGRLDHRAGANLVGQLLYYLGYSLQVGSLRPCGAPGWPESSRCAGGR